MHGSAYVTNYSHNLMWSRPNLERMDSRAHHDINGSEQLRKAFGATVTARREMCGYSSQRQFARVVPLSNSHLRLIEEGETSPRLSSIEKIASALGTDAADLVCEACWRVKHPGEVPPGRKDGRKGPDSPDR